MPPPSAKPVPSAAAGERLAPAVRGQPALPAELDEDVGRGMTVTPPASARSHSPERSDCAARCSATSDDEHAVSTDTAGPSSPSAYDTRPDATLARLPGQPEALRGLGRGGRMP